MYWAFVLIFISAIRAATSPCAVELEQALFKPKACGIEYFENLACKLNYQIPKNLHFGNAAAAEFCLRFAKENQVGLSLLDAQGHNLCTLNNFVANQMAQISRELLLRSRNERLAIYIHYFDLNAYLTVTISGPDDPNLDSVGLLYIYNYIFQLIVQSSDPFSVIPIIESVLAYIRSTSISGEQTSMDLSMNEIFALITATVPYSDIGSFTNDVFAELNPSIPIYPVPAEYYEAETAILLFYILVANTVTLTSQDQPLEVPPAARLTNYTKTENYMMLRTGAASLAKSFAQPMPINVYNDGLCTYSYNLVSSQGNLIRVVFSQTDLLFKKK